MSKEHKSTDDYIKYASIGAEIAASIAVPLLIGYWLDGYFNSGPWLLLVGCVVGLVNFFILIVKLNDRLNNE